MAGGNKTKRSDQDKNKSFSELSTDDKLIQLYHMHKAENGNNKKFRKDIRKEMKKLSRGVDHLNHRVTNIEHTQEESNNEITVLKRAVQNLQQSALSLDIVIKGMPEIEQNNNDLQVLLQTLFTKMDCAEHLNDVTDVRRIGKPPAAAASTSTSARPIVIKMRNVDCKQTILKLKRKKNISCADIVVNNNAIGTAKQIIYMDERLTPELSTLYYEARKLKQKGAYKYVWVRNGNIFLRKNDSDKAVKINDVAQISQLLHHQPKSVKNKRSRSSPSDDEGSSSSTNSSYDTEMDTEDDDDIGSDSGTKSGKKTDKKVDNNASTIGRRTKQRKKKARNGTL